MKTKAFTLIELLVVVAIITALLAITLPSVKGALLLARRAREASDTRQVLVALFSYAADHMTVLPRGDGGGQPWAFVRGASWKTLQDAYGLPDDGDPANFGCSAWSKDNPDPTWWYTGSNWHVPWIYWGNRDDTAQYTTLKRLGDAGLATSDTLLTCFARDGSAYASYIPHIERYGDAGQRFDAAWEPFDVICVGFIDGAAAWRGFDSMDLTFGGNARFFYAPRR